MKWLILTLTLALLHLNAGSLNLIKITYSERDKKFIDNNKKGKLVAALFWQESRFNSKARGVKNDLGILQITPGFVAYLNKLYGYKKYKHSDSFDEVKSLEMFWIFQNLYNPEFDKEKAARYWNGGLHGAKKTTDKYWKEVQFKYNLLSDNINYEVFVFEPKLPIR